MKAFLASILVALFGISMHAQTDTVVSLLTAYPGSDIYELEGHSAIRINMGPDRDYAVSYGLFNFNEPNFVYRFVKGETDYMVGLVPMNRFMLEYSLNGRRVEELPLNLTSTEKRKLLCLLNENLLPQNHVYRYNYVKDNCATRPLKMIEAALGDRLMLGSGQWDESGASFRDVMRFYHRNYPWYQFGIDLALGSGIDYPLNEREYTFVPMIMAAKLTSAKVGGRDIAGSSVALIDTAPDAAVDDPTPWILSPLFVCWVVFALIVLVTVYDYLRGKITRWVDSVYFFVMGLAGCLLTFLIFVSVHEATSPNYLYLWLNPLCFIPVIFIWIKSCRKIVYYYQIVNCAVLAVAILAWPWIPQSANSAFLPLVLADILLAARFVIISPKKQVPSAF